MRRIGKERMKRSSDESSSPTIKMIRSKMMNSISIEVDLSESAVSRCNGLRKQKGGTSLS
jgi:hypothetical protein